MNDINYFHRFVSKKDETKIKPNLSVWSYTRVSSKDQYDKNSSVDRQMEANKEYAADNNYNITEEFGGTYESGKSDFTRKEFTRLIEKVKSSRSKPIAILVYKMSRFSRTGGSAIGLVNTLVEDIGVHLIEVCSGHTTMTERGKIAIYESLFHAAKENLEKKEIVIPSMIASLKAGIWIGNCPTGYDRYGRKVTNEKYFSFKQRIVINKDGELLKEAWQWKASGLYSDAQIIAKLSARGLSISKQKLSSMWRTPFYCGIIINRLLDEPAKGNWEPIATKETFIKVQQVLENNISGFQHNKEEEARPLNRLLKCNDCGSHMVGYLVKKKQLHYYRCLKCNGVSVNAMTTIRSKRTGANELFIELLKKYSVPHEIAPLVKLQLTKIFNHYNEGNSANENALTSRFAELEKKLKALKIRHGLGEVDRETYDLTFNHLNDEIRNVTKELNTLSPKLSNLEKLLSSAMDVLTKLSQIWDSSKLEGKRRVQKTLFPEGIYYDAKNHEYLTKKVNSFLYLTDYLSNSFKGEGIKNPT
ncbi:recombinase family protein [Niabella hibiscisoli]|uniref:recombinase family protein n=1 Tax=Niabella hibiscisoli TaxID=1825928 RepID=UPI001F0EB046|nr:recombinase family protein [Niabella hibiscisoli]MCH5716714.1 recombinase family protein [Niabella hibiscisoli]